MTHQPSMNRCQPMSDCCMAVRLGLPLDVAVVPVSNCEWRFARIVSLISWSVCTSLSHHASLFHRLSQRISVSSVLHHQTCCASSLNSHLGQASISHCFHSFIYFPTPYIPIVCFVMKIRHDLGISLITNCTASQ